ncbi:hypothetical protein PN36_03325 [Candidatus Thiomargarita nelsonii]|uniref:NERD domain-containing protein n=1 Tax=Candidatus Thiomargarita nelsonii TaxID=1003181 RepID=A0A0A6PBF4_9GAMM|nr:hypothetical protein PN36_03325 [Candidatus Thiomargarita nelsonii]
MTRIEEGSLAFEFGERWCVFKLDEHRDYRGRIGKLSETKAVDFIGILDDKTLYFIEVKDFRSHRIANKDRLLKGKLPECQLIKGELPLPIELAQKVRDSVACIIGAYHSSSFPAHWAPYAKLLCHKDKQIKVILWLERDLPSHPSLIKKTRAFLKANVFKQQLRWLTSHVRVESMDEQRLPDVKVSQLPNS